jgi:hypothetical protein
MKKYKVKVERGDTQFWEVKARSEKEAMDNYANGNLYQTNTCGDNVEVVKEIKNNKVELSETN